MTSELFLFTCTQSSRHSGCPDTPSAHNIAQSSNSGELRTIITNHFHRRTVFKRKREERKLALDIYTTCICFDLFLKPKMLSTMSISTSSKPSNQIHHNSSADQPSQRKKHQDCLSNLRVVPVQQKSNSIRFPLIFRSL